MPLEYAHTIASQLPGDIHENLAALKRARVAQVRRLRSIGMTAREIQEATGLTYRQQLYALKTEVQRA
jgi:hypothetical protein